MKLSLIVSSLFCLVLASFDSRADPPPTVDWSFMVTYHDSNRHSNDKDPTKEGELLMPAGSPWTCVRQKAVLLNNGSVTAGFMCATSGFIALVSVMAHCDPTKAGDVDVVQATVTAKDAKAMVTLYAFCNVKSSVPKVVPLTTL